MVSKTRIDRNILVYLSPNWLLSGKSLTVIMLIVLPALIVIFDVTLLNFFQQFYLSCPPHPYPTWKQPLSDDLTYFTYLLYMLIVTFYPPYPFPFFKNVKHYFELRGYKTAVDEYELVKKILYVTAISLLVTFVIQFVHDADYSATIANPKQQTYKFVDPKTHKIFVDPKTHNTITCVNMTQGTPHGITGPYAGSLHTMTQDVQLYIDPFHYLQMFLGFIAIGSFLKILFAVSRPAFRLYFAKGCFSLLRQRKDEVEKMKYFVMGMNSYNSYLRREITLEINELRKIYSQIATSPVEVKDEVINRICKVFEADKSDLGYDMLEPVRVISGFLEKPDPQMFLTQESLSSRLKNYANFAVVAIPVLLSVLQTIWSLHSQTK